MQRILIGNLISLIAACFLAYSCVAKDRRRVFFHQFIASMIMVVSSVVLNSFSGAVSMFLCGIRNLMVSREKYTKGAMWFFCASAVVLGLWVNTRGLLGTVPVLATVQYTMCSYYATTMKGTRYSLMVNVALWLGYSLVIWDFCSALSNGATLFICCRELLRTRRAEEQET